MALSNHFRSIERGGFKWDAGSILFEFDALREPEKTQFPKIGEYLRILGIEFNEVKPQMLWCGHIVPDLYIANQLDAVSSGWFGDQPYFHPTDRKKSEWPDDLTLKTASIACHGSKFHEAFIEPMCQKIAGIPTQEVIARYHRSLWLPLYWPETLRERKSLDTRFWYPRIAYAGCIAERVGDSATTQPTSISSSPDFDRVELTITFILAKPTQPFQTLFIVDKSPIYRITNMDSCAGLTPDFHRFVVESREYCQDTTDELQRLGLAQSIQYSTQLKLKMPLPILANYRRGWRPAPTLNEQLWKIMSSQLA